MSSKPRAPAGLDRAGRRLWHDLTATYEFDPGDVLILEQAARTADDVVRLEDALRGAELLVAGSMGQVRPNPLLAELRAARGQLAALLKQLALPAVDDGPSRAVQLASTSSLATKAARARWARRGGAA